MTELLLQAFNGQLDLRRAFGFSRNQIFAFLEDVFTNPITSILHSARVLHLGEGAPPVPRVETRLQ